MSIFSDEKERQLLECARKSKYVSQEAALAIIRDRSFRYMVGSLEPFRCLVCGKWHLRPVTKEKCSASGTV